MRLLLTLVSIMMMSSAALAQTNMIPTNEYVVSIMNMTGLTPNGTVGMELLTQTTVDTIEECLKTTTDLNAQSIGDGNTLVGTCHQRLVPGEIS